ncbi:MAG TPA: hypothetical protein VJ965_12770 [Anaerolineales bacterium]|nr:hypothetical protein [Anaerolineales bacterium]
MKNPLGGTAMELNAYMQALSNNIILFGVVIAIEVACFGLLAVFYLRRQAVALRRTADIEEQRNSFLIRSRREKLAKEIEIDSPFDWINAILARRMDEPVKVLSTSFMVKEQGVAVLLTEEGKSVVVTPEREDYLKKVFKRAGQNGPGLDASNLDAAAAIVKGSKAYRAALVDRDTSDVFDQEAEKAGELLGVNWTTPDELWFFVGTPQGSKA